MAGMVAALHIGKIAPALPVLTAQLDLTLVEAGFLISLVHIAGMTVGLFVGLAIGGWGLKRSVVIGLLLCTAASLIGGFADGAALLLWCRAIEGMGFLLIALAAPGLIRNLVPPARMAMMLGSWSTYMPVGSALALLTGPAVIAWLGWPAWWWLLAAVSAGMALWVALGVPDERHSQGVARRAADDPAGWRERMRITLRTPGAWLIGFTFAVYAGQWLAIVGFLPSVYAAAGISGKLAGLLTALVAAINIIGNVSSGRLLSRGIAARTVLAIGFVGMGVSTLVAFVEVGGLSAPPWLQYVGVLVFSAIGGVIPGTLFNLAVRFAPSEKTVPTTVGWMQQWSAFGQLAIPPVVGWAAGAANGWHMTWVITGACCLLGLGFAHIIGDLLHRSSAAPDQSSRTTR